MRKFILLCVLWRKASWDTIYTTEGSKHNISWYSRVVRWDNIITVCTLDCVWVLLLTVGIIHAVKVVIFFCTETFNLKFKIRVLGWRKIVKYGYGSKTQFYVSGIYTYIVFYILYVLHNIIFHSIIPLVCSLTQGFIY